MLHLCPPRTTLPLLATLVAAATASAQARQEAYLKASNPDPEDHFGLALAAAGDLVVVGAWGEDSSSSGVGGGQTDNGTEDAGAGYVFARSGGSWNQQAYIKGRDPDRGDRFGHAVAVSGDTVVVGSPGSLDVDYEPGSAHVFVRGGSAWSHQAELVAHDPDPEASFGHAVAISGDTVLVGAPLEEDAPTDLGAAYVFVRQGNTWTQEAYFEAPDHSEWTEDRFGHAVALSGDVAVVATQDHDGVAYVYVPSGTTWAFDGRLNAGDPEDHPGDHFGHSVAVSGNTIVVGAPEEDSAATGVNGDENDEGAPGSGAVWVFERDATGWQERAYLKASNTGAGDAFGSSVAVSGDTIVVGALDEDSSATGIDGDGGDDGASRSGAAYVFVRDGSTWRQTHYLKASNTQAGDRFGRAVAAAGNTVAVGALGEDSAARGVDGNQLDESAWRAGAAYAFEVEIPLGERYCSPAVANSTGAPGTLGVVGSAEVDRDSLRLTATDLPSAPNIGYFVMGQGTTVFTPPGSAGPMCVTPGLLRYLPRVENTTELGGGFEREVGTSGPISGQITPGSTWNFQAWYRDGAGPSNLTDAVRVAFR